AAERAFGGVAAEDNSCAIAAWGFASILMSNPLQGIGAPPKNAPRAQAAIDKGRQMGAKTERERDYLEAVAAYYEDFANRPERARQLVRAKAYEALAAKYPGDDEAQIFYALYLAGTQLASDQTYSAWLKAAGILEKQFAKHPAHPGVAHYLIHSYDAPPIAQQGMPAARLYARIAPDAPHALHMPSHIFTRVGAWADSAATNRRSADAAKRRNDPDDALAALRDELKAAKNEYWANEVEVMRLASLAWVALAQKKGDEALGLMRQAADIEDKSEKNIVTPGRLLPAREQLGDMLMELRRPAE